MSNDEAFGNVEKINEEQEIEWKILNFFFIAGDKTYISSPQFSFMEISWYLRLFPKSLIQNGFATLRLIKVGHRKCSVEYNFGLKKQDGKAEHLKKGIIESDYFQSSNCFFKLPEPEVRQQESKPSDTLSILCTLKRQATPLNERRILDLPKLDKLIDLDTLSENYKSLFLNKNSCDTTLLVIGKEYKAHKTVLMARSTVFAAMFLHDTSEKQTGLVTISDCDPESFEKFLEFLYTGKLEEISSQNALHLYETSDKYDVRELKTFCAEFLIQNLTVENLCDIVIIADMYDDSRLSSVAQDFFNENLKDILRTSEWDSLVRKNYRLSKKLLEEMSLKVRIVC